MPDIRQERKKKMREELLKIIEKNSRIDLKELAVILGVEEIDVVNEIKAAFYELTKTTNLYEYGKDIIYTTEKMSLNKNVLNQKYYVVIPYYPEELGENNFDRQEITNSWTVLRDRG